MSTDQNPEHTSQSNTVLNVIIGIAVIGAVGFLAFFIMQGENSKPSSADGDAIPEVSEDDHVKGKAEADITVIEYGDFQCPACKQYQSLLARLVEENDNVRLAYRHFPLSMHDNAELAAQAAEAAAKQDAFWKYHDKLYEMQDEWSNQNGPKDTFISYAEDLELDTQEFEADMTSSEVKNTVSEDKRTAQQAGLQSTPSLVVDGEVLASDSLPKTYTELEQAVLGEKQPEEESASSAEQTSNEENEETPR